MSEINEWIESLLLDVGVEGLGVTAGIGLLWGMFFGGAFSLFKELLELLMGTV